MSFISNAIADGMSNFISEAVSKVMWIIAGLLVVFFIPRINRIINRIINRMKLYFTQSRKNITDTTAVVEPENLPATKNDEEISYDSESVFILASNYEYGRGVPLNLKKAAELYRRASNLGNVKAKFFLGNMYRDGRGVKRNYSTAIELYTESAEGGNTRAMCALARMYIDGRGVKRDYGLAVKWYQKAIDGGDVKAINVLAEMYREGIKTERNNQAAYMLFFLLKLLGDNRNEVTRVLRELTVVLSIEQINIAEETARHEAERIKLLISGGKK